MKITLQTSQGQFVEKVEILPFTEKPQVILWGDRVFLQFLDSVYRECCFAIAHTPPAIPSTWWMTSDK
ncbi:hypothetical protein A0J48_006970 [Sphaerospermopsis aphanizomenoides BCCUSP55]|uniref:hypothetical protein n=1 Tax=Sphaerospermopsis aphanizomenoides TaxID=459663 RepID=UPI001907D3DD|nr:hypothetical protein [Sphaerospermopsis aphanizomenoides]MBK1987278.1 hypothetical protein [Sphaerospermopsis aphanizomenoides BCCUSP55]